MGMSGNIQTVPLVDLLQWITSDNRTGVLILKREEHERRVYFKKGRVNSFSSSDERDRFGQFLVHCGALTPITLAQVLDEQKKSKHALGRAVVELGVMTEQEVRARLKSHATDLCTSLFLWKEGSFEFVSEDVQVDERDFVAFAISVDEILLEAHRRIDEWGRIKTVFARDDMVPKLDPERALKALSELDANSVDYMLLEHIDGRRNIADLYSGIPASEFLLYESLYRLHADGVISVSDRPVVRDITGEFLLPTKKGAVEEVSEEELVDEPIPAPEPPRPVERAAPPPPPPPKVEPPAPKPEPKPAPPPPKAKEKGGGKDAAKAKEKEKEKPKESKPKEEKRPAPPPPEPVKAKPVVEPPPAAPAAAGGSKMPMIIGGVAVVVVIGVVAAMMMGKKGDDGGPGGTPTPTVSTPTPSVQTPTPAVTEPPPTGTTPTPTPTGPSPAEQAATLATQARKALDGKKLPEAEKLANEALALDPSNAEAKAIIAKVDEAQAQGKIGAIITKGKAEERAGRLDAAEKLYQEALAEDPGNATAQQLLRDLKDKRVVEEKLAPVLDELDAAIRKQDVKAAQAALARAEGLARGDARLVQAKSKIAALETAAADTQKKEEAKARYEAAQKAVDAGDAAKAKSELAAAMALDKGNPLAAQIQDKIKALESKPVAGKITVGEPIPTNEDFNPLKFKSKVAPTFPEKSLAGKVTGKVLVSVTVGPDGVVTDAKLLKQESADTGFNEASLAAARQWRFDAPVRKDGSPAASSSWSVPIRFEP